PSPAFFTVRVKYRSLSARMKLPTLTGVDRPASITGFGPEDVDLSVTTAAKSMSAMPSATATATFRLVRNITYLRDLDKVNSARSRLPCDTPTIPKNRSE